MVVVMEFKDIIGNIAEIQKVLREMAEGDENQDHRRVLFGAASRLEPAKELIRKMRREKSIQDTKNLVNGLIQDANEGWN